MVAKENSHRTIFVKLLFIKILFFLVAASSHALIITGAETVTTKSTSPYVVTGSSGPGTWSVTGTGASIGADGVLTAGAAACGSLALTASGADGSSATKAVLTTR